MALYRVRTTEYGLPMSANWQVPILARSGASAECVIIALPHLYIILVLVALLFSVVNLFNKLNSLILTVMAASVDLLGDKSCICIGRCVVLRSKQASKVTRPTIKKQRSLDMN